MWHVWEEKRNAHKVSAEKLKEERKMQVQREAYFRLGCKGIGCEGVDLIDRGQDIEQMRAFVNKAMNFQVQ